MNIIKQQLLVGERALFHSSDLQISYSTFADGESPLKESSHLQIDHSIFKWKYPLWYCHDVVIEDSALLEMARAGIWYTDNITMRRTMVEAPKNFRRCKGVLLENVNFPNASETFWHCSDVTMKHVTAKGNYFALNSTDMVLEDFHLDGNYAFDGGKNIVVRNSVLLTKDAFWNCENVTVYDSTIIGEYLGWNSKNITFVNCVIESLQGMCYMENVVLKNCKLLNTNLAFEYSTVDAQVDSVIDSVKNPIAGQITAQGIEEIIMEPELINPEKTKLIQTGTKTV